MTTRPLLLNVARGGTMCAAVLSLLAAGCGGASSSSSGAGANPKAAIHHTVMAVFDGIADGNGAQACASISPKVRASLVKRAQAQHAGATCTAAIGSIAKDLTGPERRRLKAVTITRTTIKGDKATVLELDDGVKASDTLTRINGRWYLDATAAG